MNFSYPKVGAFYKEGTCSFTVWAPLIKEVQVLLGDNCDRVFDLQKDDYGYWTITIDDVVPRTPYLYRLNNSKILPDPASFEQPHGVHEASAIVDPSFSWTDTRWKGLSLKEMIIYELHVGTFTPQGTFDGVVAKLDYLSALGINTIELMPIAQFPGERNWGYDGVFPFAVQYSYGGVRGLKHLVAEAHKRNLAVILDVVYNHLGPEGNYIQDFCPFLTEKYKTGWGKAINFDDAWCDGVRNFYWQNALMWLNEFHIDGLRLDAVHALWDSSASHFLKELATEVTALQHKTGAKKVLIAEFDLNNPRYIDPMEKGGYGLDGQWVDEFHHALHALVTGERNGYYEDFGEMYHLGKALKDSYVYTGQYSRHRKKHFGVLPKNNPYDQFIVFAQNHDHIGNRMLGDRLSSSISREALKLVAAAVLLSPHIPMLFMGEEYGEKNPFQYFISHQDQELVELIRKGRKEEFSHFNWQGEIPDPYASKTFADCVLSWNLSEEGNKNLLDYYKYLIQFRKSRKAMLGFDRSQTSVLCIPDKKIICIERRFENDRVFILLNFEKQAATVQQPLQHSLVKILDSSDKNWLGPGTEIPRRLDPLQEVTINPESALIFEFQ